MSTYIKKYYPFLFICFLIASCSQEEGDVLSEGDSAFPGISNNNTYDANGNNPGTFNDESTGTATYGEIVENPFINVSDETTSTFSIDADGASYSNMRRYIQQENRLPPVNAIRTEELINYFDLDYEFNQANHPIDINGEVSVCPWAIDHKLVRIGIQGKPIPEAEFPASNFVFLIDVSGSMSPDNRLGLLKQGFIRFVNELDADDRIAIVTYASNAGVLLESTPGDQKDKIIAAINSLGAGGSTAGSEGIETAYQIAENNLIVGGNNRIIVGTDGNFNVGISGHDELITFIEEKRDKGVFLTILGVGTGFNDYNLEQIANHGNGTYEYLDSVEQLEKVFIYEKNKFFTVAKDVKVQVFFNPENVVAYRLIGYENRVLENEDFEDDTKDAGEIGAGQNITALYEIIPTENPDFREVQTFGIDFRYKEPTSDLSELMEINIFDVGNTFGQSSDQMKFVTSVAAFSLVLRDSEYKGTANFDSILNWLNNTNLSDEYGLKNQFGTIVEMAKTL